MTTGIGPYVVPTPADTDPAASVLGTTIIASHRMVDIGIGPMVHAETFNENIPGPLLKFNVGDTAIVRLINELDHPTGIHWHGIELANSADGTEVTQEPVIPAFPVAPPAPAPAGGTYLYKFKVPRPGLYWYHPHHHLSINRVFRGLYGMIVVADPNEATLIASGVIPGEADTRQLVLSDITVCKAPGMNNSATYVDPMTVFPMADRAEWLGGATSQPGPAPVELCEIPPAGTATNDDHNGTPAAVSYAADEVPSIIRPLGPVGRTNEGQTVLTNGMNVGGRLGTPLAPGMAPGAYTLPVLAGQGLRLQIVNCATIRYFRLILTTDTGVPIPLVRIGGEGGLLDNAVIEGGMPGGFNTKYTSGEILLPPASRADVVAAIPDDATGMLTLWTRDFERTGAGFSDIPTVPVMHLNVTGVAPSVYTIDDSTPLRASIPGAAVETLGAPDGTLLDPTSFVPPKDGMPNQDIQLSTAGGSQLGVNGIVGNFEGFTPYTNAPHIDSSRFAESGRTLQLTISNPTGAHHPFHLHGFSFQPISLTRTGFPTYTWPYREFRDNIDLPANYTLTFRVRLDDRELVDGVMMGGSLGRWLFHCHIFFHHHRGMISELVVTAADGSERPNVDVRGSWAYTPVGGIAERTGTFNHPDGEMVDLTASLGIVTVTSPGEWSWSLDTTGMPADTHYVYITATDPDDRRDQTVFRLKIGAPDDGADNGDPHVHTVDGKHYDFQAVGEFTLLRDREGMELQARHWPVETANPITDSYSGLTTCISVNTAISARVGAHRIAYQPAREGSWFQFYLDGKPAQLPFRGIDLGAHRVTAFATAGGGTGLRIDYAHSPVVTITPYFWSSHNIWILNVSVSQTDADEGLMGRIPRQTWLPVLPGGATVGPKPTSLHDRYVALYKTFANAWRVTDQTSLFVYAPGTSTKTFTDEDWPAEKPPCKLKPQFHIPGANPIREGIPIEKAKRICKGVTIDQLNRDCVFDVATTGDEEFAKIYLAEQAMRLRASSVQIVGSKKQTRRGERLTVTATVLPLSYGSTTPTGSVTFLIDGEPAAPPIKLDERGRATFATDKLNPGARRIRAAYVGNGKHTYGPSTSPNLLHLVLRTEAGEATIRRLLRFFNAARSAEDLVAGPRREVPFIDKRWARGIHLDENHADHPKPGGDGQGHGHAGRLLGRHTADHVIADRIKKSPLYGFANLRDLLEVEHFRPELLDHVFTVLGPHEYGEWEVLYGGAGTPFGIAHAALLRNGQVLFIPESFAATDTLLWDPTDANHATALRTLSSAATGLTGVLFCGAHCFLQDGKLLAVGGGTSAAGTTEAWKFDPVTETWQLTVGPMNAARWYPTAVVLGEDSGRVLVANGGTASMEIYEQSTDSFVPVHGPAGPMDTAADRAFPELYPGLHLLPNGTVFFTRTGNNTGTDPAAYFTFSTPSSGYWTGLTDGSAGEDRGRGMSLLLLRQHPTEPDRILVIGGGNMATQATVGLIDNPATSALWLSSSLPDGRSRSSVNGVLLPDGKVLICGGLPAAGMPPNGGTCYLYDPSAGLGAGAFTEMDELAYARQYHSVAILLPSGKVMTTGGSSQTIEVFSPPYLFNADGTLASRPTIDTYPDPAFGTTILHGSTFEIGSPQASDIAKVVMVRPMAVTHQTDTEQRVLSLSWSLANPTTLSVTAADSRIYPYGGGGGHTHVAAPRGYYTLFIIDSNGVPSEAKFVRLV